jgi:hypothetical protein
VAGELVREVELGNQAVGHVRELQRLGVDQQQLLLQSDREAAAAPEAVVHGLSPRAARAAMRPNTRAPARPLA